MNPADQPASEQKRRRSPRAKVFLSATLDCQGSTVPVVLRNLSEHGALIEGAGQIPTGTNVVLQRHDLSVQGHVAWVRGGSAGIAFASELKAEVVLEHIARPPPLGAAQVIHRRPGLTSRGMSAEEQKWANEMLREPTRKDSTK